jgi:hypothetical protein
MFEPRWVLLPKKIDRWQIGRTPERLSSELHFLKAAVRLPLARLASQTPSVHRK